MPQPGSSDQPATAARQPDYLEWVDEAGSLLLRIGVLGVLGWALVSRLRRLSDLDLKTEPPHFESHWGGLGKGLGGWHMNRSLVEVLFAVLLLLAFAGFGIEAISHRPAAAAQTAESSDKKKKDTAAESTSTAGESKPVAATPTSTPSTGTASAK